MSGSIKRRWSARSIGAGRAGSPSLPLLSIIGAWLLAYFFKGALIRVPPPFLWPFGAPPTLISRRKDGIGAHCPARRSCPLPIMPSSAFPDCRPRPHQGQFVNLIAFGPPGSSQAWAATFSKMRMQAFRKPKNACAQMQRLSNFACICGTRDPPYGRSS